MNLLKKSLIAAGVASVALAPMAAATAAPARLAPALAGDSDLRGDDNNGTGIIFAVIAAAAVGAVFLIADDNEDFRPISP